mgnify:CR=1 FL=1
MNLVINHADVDAVPVCAPCYSSDRALDFKRRDGELLRLVAALPDLDCAIV